MERLRAAVEGRAVEARQILTDELDSQIGEPHEDSAGLPPHHVIDLVSHAISRAPLLRVRGVGRPLPDGSPGLGDPGSIFTLGLLGDCHDWFERGRPMDLVGIWHPDSATFEATRAVWLGVWPERSAVRGLLDRRPTSGTTQLRTGVERDLVTEFMTVSDAVGLLNHDQTSSGLSLQTLCAVHRLLAPSAARSGEIRTTSSLVRLHNTPFYSAPSPAVARAQVVSLIRWLRRTWTTCHPLVRAAEAIARFTSAHPFTDGNGRVARALASWILLSASYRPREAGDLRDYTHQHLVEHYLRLHHYESHRLLLYQFFADTIVTTFEPPSRPWPHD